MHALTLLVPAGAVETRLATRSPIELDALSVSVEDADAGSAAEQPVFDEPGVAADGGWQPRSRAARCSPTKPRRPAAAAAAGAATRAATAFASSADRRSRRSGLGAPDAVAVRAGRNHARLLDRAELVTTLPAATRAGDPPRPRPAPSAPARIRRRGMCLRWIAAHGSAAGVAWPRVLDYGCGSGVLAIGARADSARATIDAVDIDPAAVEATRRQRARQRRRAARRPARQRRRRVRAGARQHPGRRRSSCSRRCSRRWSTRAARSCSRASSSARPTSWTRPMRRGSRWTCADEDDGWILMIGRRHSAARMA